MLMKNVTLSLIAIFGIFSGFHAQTSGGPDAYGYMWYNSNDPQGPSYSWVDITTTGTQITGLGDDNSVPFINMSQPFHYYWSDYTQLKVGSNGWFAFDNVSNIASCFPSTPTAGGAGDNFLAPFMSDLIFGAGIPGSAWYYDDTANDRFIVSFVDVPWWSASAPGYTGSNTFQVILSSADSSITFQYQNLSTNFNTGCVNNLEIGIENMTGNIGLEVYNNFVPAANHAVRFEYPAVVTFQVQDPAPLWSQSVGNHGTFVSNNETFSRDVAIRNYGNTDITTNTTVLTQLLNASSTVVWSQTDVISTLNAGQSQTISYTSIGPLAVGAYTLRTTTTNANDINPANNILSSEIESVNYTSNPITASYATTSVPTGNISWSSGGGVGVYIEPSTYPLTLDAVSAYVQGISADYTIAILDDDGVNGAPGTVLSTQIVPNGSFTLNSWVMTTLPTALNITSGGFYIAWIHQANTVSIGTETTAPISRNSWEFLGGWADYRDNTTQEFMLRAHFTNNCLNVTSSVDLESDASCFGSQDGSAQVTISGAQNPVVYSWSNGTSVEDPTGLAAGMYTLTYTDFAGCTGTLTVTIDEPTDVVGAGVSSDEMLGNDGSIDLTVTGGTAPYTYAWSNSATTEGLSGLAAGTYACTITDDNGCTEVVTVTVNSQVGLNEATAVIGFTIYPNPNSGQFTIELEDKQSPTANVNIVNAVGQVLWKSALVDGIFEVNTVIPAGVYFIEMHTESGTAKQRIVVQ